LLSKLSGSRPLLKSKLTGIRHPFWVRVGTTDASVLLQVLVERHYDFNLPIEPRRIVDAGANIGLSALFFANKFPNSTIVAVEPEEANFRLLLKNVAPYPQIRALNAALWSKNKRIILIDPGDGSHGFLTRESSSTSAKAISMVEARSLDSIMTELDWDCIDLLKVDIEGAEKELFEGSAPWIDNVQVILVELHDNVRPGCAEAFYRATSEFTDGGVLGETIMRLRTRKI